MFPKANSLLLLLSLLLFASAGPAQAGVSGKMINPISDVLWSEIFPISIAGVSIKGGSSEETGGLSSPICTCATPFPRVGIPLEMYEPARVIETVKDAYYFPLLGVQLMDGQGATLDGSSTMDYGGKSRLSFQQAHYFIFPVWTILEVFLDFVCLESSGIDLGYLTEIDPLWNDDLLSLIIQPEALLFANPVAQAACVADAGAANAKKPLDPLFWCAGSGGSVYPLSGHVFGNDRSMANATLASRMIYKLSRQLMLHDTGINQCTPVKDRRKLPALGLVEKPDLRRRRQSAGQLAVDAVSQTQMLHLLMRGKMNVLGKTLLLWFLLAAPGLCLEADGEELHQVFLDAPSPCYSVDRVLGAKVFLKKKDGNCIEAAGKIPARLPAGLSRVSIYIAGELWKEQDIRSFNIRDIEAVHTSARVFENVVRVPDAGGKTVENSAAQKMAKLFHSEAFQNKLREESKRVKRDVFRETFQEGASESGSDDEEKGKDGLSEDERIYVFISESVPLQTLRNLAADLAKGHEPHATMVLRGFVGGMAEILPTARFISSVQTKDPNCNVLDGQECPSNQVNIQVDPNLFRRYQIEQVPAVVFAQGVNPLDHTPGSEGLQEKAAVGDWFAFFGDGSLKYSLERINRKAQSPGLTGLIKRVSKGVY